MDDKRHVCEIHHDHSEKIYQLIKICAANSSTLGLVIKFVGASITSLVVILGVMLPLAFHQTIRTNERVTIVEMSARENRDSIEKLEIRSEVVERVLREEEKGDKNKIMIKGKVCERLY